MPIVDMHQMLDHAYRNGYAVGAFDAVSLDFVSGIVAAAERCRAPVILSLAESHFDYFDFDLLMPALETAAQRATVPVAIHLDHGASHASAVRGINTGCNGVMVDASHRPFEENVAITTGVVDMAHACGVPVEGELGYVPGVEGEDAERHPGALTYTSVEEAREYVQRTGIDFLAVSVGTVHGRMRGEPHLDFDRLDAINEALGIPLVLHGGTGLSDAQYRRLIGSGIAKINYYTALADVAGACIRDNAESGVGGYTALLRGSRQAVQGEVEQRIRLWGGADRAEAVLAHCEPWRPVEHMIVYNPEGESQEQIEMMMAEGRRVLSTIPGVRAVFTGRAVQGDARYRNSWSVRFCHPLVIESYRNHPAHVAFADNWFRPLAQDRLTIDYRAVVGEGASEPDRRSA